MGIRIKGKVLEIDIDDDTGKKLAAPVVSGILTWGQITEEPDRVTLKRMVRMLQGELKVKNIEWPVKSRRSNG